MSKLPAKTTDSAFAITTTPDAPAALTDAYASLGIDSFNLNRLSIPAGGATAWQVETLEGTETLTDVEVIIAGIKGNEKVWWRDDFSGNGGPPDCSSHDGITGFGNNTKDADKEPGEHACRSCPWNQWTSARSGGPGKDCGDIAFMVFFRKDALLPDMLVVPPSSLKAVRDYSMKLMQAGKHPRKVATKMSLVAAQSNSGIKYTQLKLSYVSDLDQSAIDIIAAVSTTVMRSFTEGAVSLDHADLS